MSRRRRLEHGSLFALSLLPLMMAASGAAAQALPSGGTVASGTAAIGYTSANDMTITQTSGKAIINWGDFSIGQGKSVTFENGTGATLNRVTGANVSNLNGALNATGSVYLINPNGVIVGSTGVVNVGGSFVASTLNLTDANFLAGGTLTFQGPSTAVVKNLGKVGALGGDVALIAAAVTNEGTIEAGGTAGLAAGAKVLVRESSARDNRPTFNVMINDASLDGGRFMVEIGAGDVTNIGAITAVEAELRANGGNVYALAGNTGGMINTRETYGNNPALFSSENGSGRVFLTAGTGSVTSSGTITAEGAVTMQGAQVAIAGTHLQADEWTIDANSFTIGDAEATVLNGAMVYGDYDDETGEDTTGGASVNIIARIGDIVLDTSDVTLNIGDRELNLSAFRNVTLNDAISATRTYDYPWYTSTQTGYLFARSDSTGTGTGVVSGVRLNQGSAYITTNVADYSTYSMILDGLYAANPDADSFDLTMLVNSYADLKRIATDYDGDQADGRFLVSRDIDASASADGNYVGAVLSGVFQGEGHTISNLQVTGTDAGLFAGIQNGQVNNLNLAGGSATGSLTAGAVAGWMIYGGINGVTSSMNVSNTGTDPDTLTAGATGGIVGRAYSANVGSNEVSGTVTGANKVGGIVGHAVGGNTNYNVFSGELTGVDQVGGITGLAENSNVYGGQVTGSVAGRDNVGGAVGRFNGSQYYRVNYTNVSGTVTGSGSNTGGVIGLMDGAHLSNSTFSGAVVGVENTGGLVGSVQNNYGANSGVVEYSTVSGSVTGGDYTGGLVGLLANSTSLYGSVSSATVVGHDNVGGAVGGNSASNFYSAVASGSVTGSGQNVGGLVGVSSGAIRDSSASGDVVGSGGVGGLVGYSMANIERSHASGTVTGRDAQDSGDNWITTSVGGLVGFSYYSSVYNSSASGAVGGEGAYFGGLLGYAYGATINDNFATGAVSGQHVVGGLIGAAGSVNLSTNYATGAVTGGVYDGPLDLGDEAPGTGGLIGLVRDNASINTSYATGKVIGADNTGGLIGLVARTIDIQNSWANGDVSGGEHVGGLIGGITLDSYASASISNTYATGKVTGDIGVGGLIGYVSGESQYDSDAEETFTSEITLNDSYASGAVSGDFKVGGLVGENNGGLFNISRVYATGSATGTDKVGGLIGYMHTGLTISEGYATGAVSGGSATGGLFGHYDASSSVSNLYWDTDSSGTLIARGNDAANLDNTTGLTRDQAFEPESYAGFGSGWIFINGVRPLLASEQSSMINNVHQLQLIGGTGSYALARDFSASETVGGGSSVFKDGFVTIGATSGGFSQFNGQLNGQGYAISGLKIVRNASDNGGLFDTIGSNGQVYDLKLVGGSVDGEGADYVGSIAGQNFGWVEAVSSSMVVSGGNYATGGLVGYNGGGIGTSAFKGEATGTVTGGIAGQNQGYIVDSYSAATLTGANKVGGIAGFNSGDGDETGVIDTVLSTSTLVGQNKVGALVGGSFGGLVKYGRWSTTVSGDLAAIGENNGTVVENTLGYSTADLQDESKTAEVYASVDEEGNNIDGFDLRNVWALGTGAAISGDGQAHFAELYRADNIFVVDARSQGTYGDSSFDNESYSSWGYWRDNTSFNVSVDTSAFNETTHAGTYHLNVQATVSGPGSYRVIKLDTLTVGKRQVYIDLNGGVTKTYDGTNTAVLTNEAFTQYNVMDGDSLTLTATGTYAGSGVGSGLTVTADNLVLGGANAGDYEIGNGGSMVSNVGYINHALVTGTVTSTKTYDGTTALGANATTGFTGLVGEDTLAATFSNVVYADKNAGTNKAITGSVSVDLSDSNYAVTSFDVAGTGQIDVKTITAGLGGSVTKTYDGATTATLGDNLSLSGVVEGDTVSVGASGAAYADKNAGTGKTVTASGLTLGGGGAGNYVLASDTASAAIGQINAKVITAGLGGTVTKTYDGTTAATLGDNLALSGLVSGDTVTVAGGGAAYADKNTGTGKAVTINGVTIAGADAGNYVLASTTASAAIGQINAKTITVGLGGTVTKTYDGTTTATLGDNLALSGLVSGDTVTVAGGGAAYADKNAGTGKAVTVNGVTIAGADAGNYVLASTTTSANVGVIGQKALTITADNQVKNRNDLDPALTYVSTGLVTGDALTGALTRETGEAVGSYGILQGTLSGGGNYAVTYNRALLTINLGIPPVENLIIPYIPADGGGSTTNGASSGSGGAGGQKDGGTSVGFQLAVQETGGDEPSTQQDGGDDTTTCAVGEACHSAPYTQGGSTSGAIHFQGFMH